MCRLDSVRFAWLLYSIFKPWGINSVLRNISFQSFQTWICFFASLFPRCFSCFFVFFFLCWIFASYWSAIAARLLGQGDLYLPLLLLLLRSMSEWVWHLLKVRSKYVLLLLPYTLRQLGRVFVRERFGWMRCVVSLKVLRSICIALILIPTKGWHGNDRLNDKKSIKNYIDCLFLLFVFYSFCVLVLCFHYMISRQFKCIQQQYYNRTIRKGVSQLNH